MAEIETKEMEVDDQIVAATSNDDDKFFDAAEDQNLVEKNENTKDEDEDEDFLKKIDEAINEETEKAQDEIANTISNDIDEILKADSQLNDEINFEKSENDLLKDLDDDTNDDKAIEDEIEKLVSSVTTSKDDDEDEKSKEVNESSAEVSEEPREVKEKPLEEDEKSTQLSEEPAEVSEKSAEEDEKEEISNLLEDLGEKIESENENIATQEENSKESEESTSESNDENKEMSATESEEKIEENDSISTLQLYPENGNDEDEESATKESDEPPPHEIKCEDVQNSDNDEDDHKMIIDETQNETDEANESQQKIKNEIDKISIKNENKVKSEVKMEEEEDVEPIKLNFMKKFASEKVEKMSRAELEELVLQKVTESIVFRTTSAEYRAKYEKQTDVIENLKQRLAALGKQYNDLEMIHKRIIKDLKDRPEQPVTPVKITRAVGLQVYQPGKKPPPSISNNNNNNNKSTVKRPNEIDSSESDKDSDTKRKKPNKIVTPMRPPLSEKEKASIDLQAANIEKTIRTKIAKADASSSTLSMANVTIKAVTNGNSITPERQNSSSSISSSQSIDLTDDIDETPPALVAIKNNNNARTVVAKSTAPIVRTPDMINRSVINRNNTISTSCRHPAPLPPIPPHSVLPGFKKVPPRPAIKISSVPNGIIVSWTLDLLGPEHSEISSYQIYAYEETKSPPSTSNWKHVGDVKALQLPMAVTLTQFQEGQKYHFAVRAVDVHRRIGQFSQPRTW